MTASPGFIGMLHSLTWGFVSQYCESDDYWRPNIEPGLAGCCMSTQAAEKCAIHRDCAFERIGSLGNHSQSSCQGNTACEPIVIFEYYPPEAATTSWSQWRCGNAGTTTSLYRNAYIVTSEVTKTTLSAAATVSESTFQTVPTVSTKTTPAFSPSETAPIEQQLTPTGSKAWIAGAVAGPIVAIVLLAALVFFRRRLRAKNPDPDDARARGGLGPGLGSQGTKDGATASRTNQFTLVEKPELDGSGKAMTEAVELPCPDYVKAPKSHELQAPQGHQLQAPPPQELQAPQPHELGVPVPGETSAAPGKDAGISGVS